jgi:dihydropyrimidinase
MSGKRYDVVIRGGKVINGQGGMSADIAISEGKIELMARNLSEVSAARVIDATGKLVMPGVIDAHTHPVYDDDMEGTTRSGVFGGVTTILGFVGPNPAWGLGTNTLSEAIKWFIDKSQDKTITDYGLHGVVINHDDVVPQLPNLIKMGVLSIKFFMMYKKRGMMLPDDTILRVMEGVAENGAIAIIHAENGAAIDYLTDKLSAQPVVGHEAYNQAHRDLLEAEAVFRAMALAEAAKCPLYIPHLAVKEGVEIVRAFKERIPVPIFVETCPHYLVLTNQVVLEMGPLAKIAPPIREKHDNEALWEGLRDGTVSTVGTDHCGLMAAVKRQCNHILDARFGAGGIEFMLPLMYSEGVRKGRISLGRMVEVLCENPAKIFGLWPRKGVLMPGSDADVVIFDPEKKQVASARTHHSKVDYSIYEGMEMVGAPMLVMQRGKVLVENENLRGKPGDGQFLARKNPVWDKFC